MIKKNIEVYSLIEAEIHKLRSVGIETANLDCRLLLSKSLNSDKTLYNHQIIDITENEINNFKNLIKKRLTGQPVSRIINKRNFWKKEFKLNEETLDPRSDSETLIDTVLTHFIDKLESLKILKDPEGLIRIRSLQIFKLYAKLETACFPPLIEGEIVSTDPPYTVL